MRMCVLLLIYIRSIGISSISKDKSKLTRWHLVTWKSIFSYRAVVPKLAWDWCTYCNYLFGWDLFVQLIRQVYVHVGAVTWQENGISLGRDIRPLMHNISIYNIIEFSSSDHMSFVSLFLDSFFSLPPACFCLALSESVQFQYFLPALNRIAHGAHAMRLVFSALSPHGRV